MEVLVLRLNQKLQLTKILGAGVVRRLCRLRSPSLLLRAIASRVVVDLEGVMIFSPMYGSELVRIRGCNEHYVHTNALWASWAFANHTYEHYHLENA